ncbi:MAG: hypothetical protein ABJ360_02965 [Roseobacter sp.]
MASEKYQPRMTQARSLPGPHALYMSLVVLLYGEVNCSSDRIG